MDQVSLTHGSADYQSHQLQQQEDLHGFPLLLFCSSHKLRCAWRMRSTASGIELYTVPQPCNLPPDWPAIAKSGVTSVRGSWQRTQLADTNGPAVSIHAIGQRQRAGGRVTPVTNRGRHAPPPLPHSDREMSDRHAVRLANASFGESDSRCVVRWYVFVPTKM